MKKLIILSLIATGLSVNVQAQDGMIRCGSLAHQEKVDTFLDLFLTGSLPHEHKAQYEQSFRHLVKELIKLNIHGMFFKARPEVTQNKLEKILDSFFGCKDSLAWLRGMAKEEGLQDIDLATIEKRIRAMGLPHPDSMAVVQGPGTISTPRKSPSENFKKDLLIN